MEQKKTNQRRETTASETSRVDNDHQKTVSGKKQHGPEGKAGRNAGGNEGSKSQNVDQRRAAGTSRESGDRGDEQSATEGQC